MANGTPTNPFGLVDERVLRQIRANEAQAQANLRRSKTSGVQFASSELGHALGTLLGGGLVRAGVINDPEAARAKKITAVQNKVSQARAEKEPSGDAFADSIAERQELAAALRAEGLFPDANTVLSQINALSTQKATLDKLEGEARSAQSKADVDERTATDKVHEQRLKVLQSSLDFNFDYSTANTRRLITEQELEVTSSKAGHEKQMRPFQLTKAKADAQVAQAEAAFGGTIPSLVKLQAKRDDIAIHMAANPNDEFAQRNFKEINSAIQTQSQNILRNVDNFQPTNAVLGGVQTDVLALSQFQGQIEELRNKLTDSVDEPFGSIANTRSGIASSINTVGSLVGLPQSLTSKMADFVMSDDELGVRSESRQLQADVISWLSGNSRATQTDVQTAELLTQAMADTTDRRTSVIAMTNLAEWLANKQLILNATLLEGMRAVTEPTGAEATDVNAATSSLFDSLKKEGAQ